MIELEIKQISHNSDLYQEAVKLRYKILRKPLNLTFSPSELEAEVDQFHFVALLDNQVVGVLILTSYQNIWKMRQVAVDENAQGQGIGAKMVLYAEDFAREHSASEIKLHARMTAKKFYQNLDYSTNHEVFTEVGLPHVLMWKSL